MCVCLCEAVFLAATNIWFWCLDVDKKEFLEILNVLIHDRSHLTEICLWSAHAEEQRYPLITFIYHDVTTQRLSLTVSLSAPASVSLSSNCKQKEVHKACLDCFLNSSEKSLKTAKKGVF